METFLQAHVQDIVIGGLASILFLGAPAIHVYVEYVRPALRRARSVLRTR